MEELIQKQKAHELKKQKAKQVNQKDIENHSNRFSWDGDENHEEKGDIDDWAIHIDEEVVAAISPPKYDKKRQKSKKEPKISQEHSSKQKQNSKQKTQNDKLIRMEEIGLGDSFFSGENLDFSQNLDNSDQKMIKNKSVTKQKK